MKLSVIIPVFNEEKTISQLLKKVKDIELSGIEKEIIVVDDGSTDSTSQIIQKENLKDLKYLKHEINKGKGAAIKTGIAASFGELVLIQDADLEYDPIHYAALLKPILEGEAKVVYGTRLINYPLIKAVLPSHLLANRFLTFLTNILYDGNLTDMETGYKLFKSEIIKKIQIKSNRFDFEPEITLKLLKLKIPIVEVPIEPKPRTYKEGKKITWIDGIIAVWVLFKYKFTN